MSKPALDAFFFGRAVAEVLYEKIEDTFTDALSELGKFDAEQRERLRQFTEEVSEKAKQEAQRGSSVGATSHPANGINTPVDLQAMVDDLRAEIARLRSELKHHGSQTV